MMKKITLMLVTLTMFCGLSLNSQVLMSEALTDGAVPAGWIVLDEDGVAADVFFTDQGLWDPSEWTGVNFGGTAGVALYAPGEFATAPTTASDWLITGQVTLGPSTEVSAEIISFAAGCTFDVMIATTLAGATPVPSDFVLLGSSLSLSGAQTWDAYDFDLTAYAGQSAYFAFVNTTADPTAGNGVKLVGIRNVEVFQPAPFDGVADGILLGSTDVLETDYLVNNRTYAVYSCLGNGAETVSIVLTNNGNNPIDSLDVGFQMDDSIPVIESIIPGSPIAPGATYTHTFAGMADFLTAGDPFYQMIAWVDVLGEGDPSNDTTFIDFVITPPNHDMDVDGDYIDNFDQVDFGIGQIQNLNTSWAWTLIDANNDGFPVSITPNVPNDAFSGDFALLYEWNDNATTAADDYAFTPCIDFMTGVGYRVSLQAAAGEDQAGNVFPESFRFVRNSSASNTGATIIDLHDVTTSSFEQYSSSFVVPSAGTYYLGIHVNSPEDRFFLKMDDFEITSFTDAPTAALSLSGADEVNGTTFVEYCDSTVTVNNASTGIYDDAVIDWGDGSPTESFVGSSLSHSYSTLGSFMVVITASNVLGTSMDTVDLDVTALPAPSISFIGANVNGFDVSVAAGATGITITPSCATLVINWGDGTTEEVTGQSSYGHTYTSEDTYTIEATVLSGGAQASATQTVTIVDPNSINDVNFATALSVYPNPANAMVNVNFGLVSNETVELTLVSVDGRIIETREFTNAKDVNTTFNTTSMNNGVYVLKIKTDSGLATKKFVVSHN